MVEHSMELTLDEALAEGIAAHKAGRIQEAGKFYSAIIQAEPTHPDANHNFGLLSVSLGEIEEATTFFKVALVAKPSVGQFWLSYIDSLMELGRTAEAQALVYQAKYKGMNVEIIDQLEQRLTDQWLKISGTKSRKVDGSSLAKPNILDTIKLDKALKLAKQKSKAGQLHKAKNICTDILQKFPKNAQALTVLQTLVEEYSSMANALMQKGDSEAAIDAYKQAISIKPDYAEAYYNIGVLLENNGNPDAAIDSYKHVLRIIPKYAGAHNNIGNALKDKGDLEAAIGSYSKAVLIKPDYAEAYYNLGLAQHDKGDLKAAIDSYNRAILIKPEYAEAYNNIGNALKDKGELETAIDYYKRALSINTDYANAHYNMGNALKDKGELEAAINSYQQALKINPNYVEACSNLGVALKDSGRLEAAIDCYQRVLKTKPNYAEAHYNMGIALKEKGDLEIAMESYNRAINIEPDYADVHINKAFLHLGLMDFEAGWLLYEWRWKASKNTPQFLKTSKPLWKPSMRQRVLLWSEQGLGDEIMFASLILDMHSLSSKLIVQVDQRLIGLFKRSFPNDIDFRPRHEIVSETDYDTHIPLGSAPFHFRQSIESFKGRSKGWLSACGAKAKTLRSELLRDDSEVLIGISWNTTAHRNGAQNRLITLNQIATMLQAPKVRLVSLQYGDFVDEVKKLSTDYGFKVAQVTEIDNMNDIDGLAALISACDRIVSIDNTTVHLAGALGKETKVLLPFACDWRWGQSSQDSYWYDSVKLYRQVIIGDWEHVIKNYKTLTKSKPITSNI
jgi:tetratricopeptide (TPR) repeat protein